MTIDIGTTTARGRYSVSLPDPSAISVPSVAKAAIATKEAEAEVHALRRERDAALVAVDSAKSAIASQAAELKIKKKKLGKEILAPLRDAEEVAELAQVNFDASIAAFEHSYEVLVAEVRANRKTLEEVALADAQTALQRLAAAKVAFASASVDAHASYGVLGMFWENDRTGAEKLTVRDRAQSRRKLFTDEAILALDKAVGHNAIEYEAFKRGEAPTREEVQSLE